MQQKLHSAEKSESKKNLCITEGIFPFNEIPSTDRFLVKNEDDQSIDVDVLFSLFTADIINEKIVFTR